MQGTRASLAIHQIYYQPEQLNALEPEFIPYDNCVNENPEWCEYHIFRKFYHSAIKATADYNGFVSWKFKEKTGLTGEQFKQFIWDNPGYDLYAINPFPLECMRFHNIWQQGEKVHPNLIPLAKKALQRINFSTTLFNESSSMPMKHETVLFCNYWAGNTTFWNHYMAICEPVYHYLTTGLNAREKKQLNKLATKHNNTTYAPYIMERMISTLIHTNEDLKICIYPWTAEEMSRPFKYATAENIKILLELRRSYEENPTPYKLTILYHLMRIIRKDNGPLEDCLTWSQKEFKASKFKQNYKHYIASKYILRWIHNKKKVRD